MLLVRNRQHLPDEDKYNLYDALARDVSDIWRNSNIPFDNIRWAISRVKKLIKEAENISNAKKGYYKDNAVWIEKTRSEYEVLFDIAQCPCFKSNSRFLKNSKPLDISQVIPANCKCSVESGKKILDIKQNKKDYSDFEFYRDQIFSRKLDIISSIDVISSIEMDKNSKKLESRKRRREADEKALENARSTSSACLDDTISLES